MNKLYLNLCNLTLAAGLCLNFACSKTESNNADTETEGEEDTGDMAGETGTGEGGAADGGGDEGADGAAAEEGEEDAGPADEGEDDGGDDGIVAPPDGGAMSTCDPAAQDCPEGEKCTAYLVEPGGCCVDANKCVPVIGNLQVGDACVRTEDNDDCDTGLFCMTKTSGDTGEGLCMAMCNAADNDCEDKGLGDAECVSFNDGVLPLCEQSCNPLNQDCPDNMACYAAGDGFACAVPGHDEGSGNNGDSCETIQGCQKGLICSAAAAQSNCEENCCSFVCDLDGTDLCTDENESCVAFFQEGMTPPGLEKVGVCAVPET